MSEKTNNICPICGRSFILEKWYRKCENCCILIPESKEILMKEIDIILVLRSRLKYRLHEIEQKYISQSNELTDEEYRERVLWSEHNQLYLDLEMLMGKYDIKDVRLYEIYPKLYSYVKVIEAIKAMLGGNDGI